MKRILFAGLLALASGCALGAGWAVAGPLCRQVQQTAITTCSIPGRAPYCLAQRMNATQVCASEAARDHEERSSGSSGAAGTPPRDAAPPGAGSNPLAQGNARG